MTNASQFHCIFITTAHYVHHGEQRDLITKQLMSVLDNTNTFKKLCCPCPHWEGIKEEYRYSSTHSLLQHWKEVSGQSFYGRKRTPVPTKQAAGWAPLPAWTFRGREKSHASTGI
jgi:hypothetical protein